MPTRTIPDAKPRLALLCLSVCTLLLAGCELRRDQTADEPAPAEEPAAQPTADEPDNPISIIREEIVPEIPIALPPEPLEMVLPFPDGADLTPQAERMLAEALDSDAMAEGWPIVIGGHTDSSGNDQANLRASRSRAENVAAWLVERGVADERITVIAFGEQNPIEPNALPDGQPNEPGRAANRRVELTVAPAAEEPAARPTDDSATGDMSDDA